MNGWTRRRRKAAAVSSWRFSMAPANSVRKCSKLPSRPGFRNENCDHSSRVEFSTGVPVRVSLWSAWSSRAALADCETRVLDGLRLVQDDVVEPVLPQHLDVAEQDAVGGQDQVVLVKGGQVFGAGRAGMVQQTQAGREPGRLALPVEDQRARQDEQGGGFGLVALGERLQEGERTERSCPVPMSSARQPPKPYSCRKCSQSKPAFW